MNNQLESSGSQAQAQSSTDLPFFLFGEQGRRAVPCQARWVSDRYAYVVAPLATARAVKQQWEATAFVPGGRQSSAARQQHVQVELMSAETLMGADSGREGLLLRFLGSKEGTAPTPPTRTDTAGSPHPAGA
ncbi:MAG: hypothetical protein GY778_02365 [bacterium]|nr:hypothetical protein [bacterium]